MAGDKFKVFISWSGELAKQIATVWQELVNDSFDDVLAFMSEEAIGPGERGLPKIAEELAGTGFGIIVVTQENQLSPWLNYEAGALSKDFKDDKVRVAPSLVDFERKNDVQGPLGQFQAKLLNREGVEAILLEIAKVIEADSGKIQKRFAASWEQEYEKRFADAVAAGGGVKPSRRPDSDILDDILSMVREMYRSNQKTEWFTDLATLMGAERRNTLSELTYGKRAATLVTKLPDLLAPPPPSVGVSVGTLVDSPDYGRGVVEKVERVDNPDGTWTHDLTVLFEDGERRTIYGKDWPKGALTFPDIADA